MEILETAVEAWRDHGYSVLPGFLDEVDLGPARAELPLLFPSAAGFHDGTDPRRNRFLGDEFAGIDPFPTASVEVNLLCVHPKLTALAEVLLGSDDIRLYSAEAWAKYTGAADYDQPLHRDLLNHTVLVPSSDQRFRQVELFVFLCDVPEQLGPPHYVSVEHTTDLPILPNWRTRDQHEALYDREASSTGPQGTVVAYTPATLHRGTRLVAPRGARYTMHVSYRQADAEWAVRQGWADVSHEPAWYTFVDRASVRQLQLFGFPCPGHPFWTDETVAGMQVRYPGFAPEDWLP